MYHKLQDRIASILIRFEGGCNYHQCSVGVVDIFVGLCEPHDTLALWLGWMQHQYGIQILTVITQSSKKDAQGGHLPKSCTNSTR
jgi:hypothetical protein